MDLRVWFSVKARGVSTLHVAQVSEAQTDRWGNRRVHQTQISPQQERYNLLLLGCCFYPPFSGDQSWKYRRKGRRNKLMKQANCLRWKGVSLSQTLRVSAVEINYLTYQELRWKNKLQRKLIGKRSKDALMRLLPARTCSWLLWLITESTSKKGKSLLLPIALSFSLSILHTQLVFVSYALLQTSLLTKLPKWNKFNALHSPLCPRGTVTLDQYHS